VDGWATKPALAAILGAPVPAIAELGQMLAGADTRTWRRRLYLRGPAVARLWARRMATSGELAGGADHEADARARLAHAQAERAELSVERMRGRFVDREAVRSALDALAAPLRDSIAEIERRHGPDARERIEAALRMGLEQARRCLSGP